MVFGFIPVSNLAKGANALYWPVPGHTTLSQGWHNGNAIDISDSSIAGAKIIAAMGGKVIVIHLCGTQHYGSFGDCNGFGTGLVIAGDDGRVYQYCHMQAGSIPSNVYYGAYVSAGQEIGKVGTTGNSTGNHLHFGISYEKYWYESGINPQNETYIYNSSVNVNFTSVWTSDITETNAKLNATIDGINVDTCGYYLGESASTLSRFSENTNAYTKNIWFDLNEYGKTLKAGTTYFYKIFVTVGGKEYCSDLNSFKTAGNSHAHSYTSKITKDATCEEEGIKTFTCSCGNSYTEKIAAMGHYYSPAWTVDVKPTCITTGSKSHHCLRCNSKKDITTIDKTEHTYSDEWTIEVEPSCLNKTSEWSAWSSDASKLNNPIYDSETKTEYRSRTKSTTTSSSSTMSGWTRYDAKVTSWNNWSAWQNNAVSASESRQVETRTIDPTYKTVWCYYSYESSDGKRSYTYSAANTTYRYIELDYALAQKGVTDEYNIPRYGSYPLGSNGTYLQNCWYASNPATKQVQTSAGYTQYRYRDGNYTYYFYKWSNWSDWSSNVKTANDTTDVETRTQYRYKIKDEFINGCKSRTCTVCDEKSEIVAIPIEHDYTNAVIITKPTCTNTGIKKGTCSVCGNTYTETIKATGHKAVTDKAIAATCQSEGKTEGSHCSVCGETIKAQTTINKIPHDYKATVKNATCTADGEKTYKCSMCGDSYSEPIPATGHSDTDGDGKCDSCGADLSSVSPSTCDHICHKGGISKFFYKIALFFWKIFKINKTCQCGMAHY